MEKGMASEDYHMLIGREVSRTWNWYLYHTRLIYYYVTAN